MRRCWQLLVLVALGGAGAFAQEARVVFEDRFTGEVKPQWSANQLQILTTPQGNQRYLGPFGGESVQLALTDLPEHLFVKVSLDILIARSWDGNAPVEGPDILYIFSDDGRVLHATSFSWLGAQAYPGFFGVHTAPPATGASVRDRFGFMHEGSARDGIFRIEFMVPHREARLGLRMVATTQSAISDEMWGITGARVTLETPPSPEAAALARAWEDLGSADPAVAAEAVWTLACGGDAAVSALGQRLTGAILPTPMELLDPSHTAARPKSPNADGFALTDSPRRRVVLAAHVLQLIGTDSARALRRAMVVRPVERMKTTRITVHDRTTRQPIPFVPIWTYLYSAALHASAVTDAQGQVTIDVPSQGVTNILFQNARAVYVPVGIRTTATNLPATLDLPLERAVPVGGIVTDVEHKPVEGATVVITMTYRVDPPLIARLGSISALTDSLGRWSMDLGPAAPDGIQISVRPPRSDTAAPLVATGYLHKLQDLQAQTLVLTIPRPTLIRGTVIDADTNKPVEKFQVFFARITPAGLLSAFQPLVSGVGAGRFELPVPQTYEGVIIRIDAEGYLTTHSELIPGGGGTKELEMKLYSPR